MRSRAVLVKGGELYLPEAAGVSDVLIVADRVAAIGPSLEIPSWADGEVVDARGALVVPGLVDQHVHIAGGGGEGGPQYRTPEIMLSDLTRHGITTVVGVLGTDGTTRSVQGLLAKARALTEEGIQAWIYTGAYQVPTRTVTATPRSDIVLIDRVLGIGEIAISDHRGSHPDVRQLAELAGEARVGGLLAGKAGVLHLHVGDGDRRLRPLFQMMETADIPLETLVPTHLNRNEDVLADAVRFGRMGGYVDLTTGIVPDRQDPDAVGPVEAMARLRAEGVPLDHVSFSSDAQGSAPVFNEQGHLITTAVGSAKTLWDAAVGLHERLGWDWHEALMPVTRTPAAILKLADAGRIAVRARADLLVVRDGVIETVVAGGRIMVSGGQVLVRGTFESREAPPC